MPIAEDASTRAVLHVPYGTSGMGTTASFSPLTCADSPGNGYVAGPAQACRRARSR